MGGASGGVSTSRKRPHDAQELISIARKVMKLNKDALDARLMQVIHIIEFSMINTKQILGL
jgi:hypothetical protein